MIAAEKLNGPRREVILLPEKNPPARANQDQPSQRIRPEERGSVLLNLPILLQERGNALPSLLIRLRVRAKARVSTQDPETNQKDKVDGSTILRRAKLQKAKRATQRRASPRKALPKAPPRRASPRTSTTARARARSEAV